MSEGAISQKPPQGMIAWLLSVCALILGIVVVGGITRLTHSGLSIVEWRPLTGVIPPLTEHDWQAMFQKYQQFPEYQLMNYGMSLAEFKRIFFWEYIHRLIGRLIGVVFFVPWIYYLIRRQLNRPLAVKLLGALILGGLQGVMGWYMVKSGLVKDPKVSHYRLAAHLSLALLVLIYIFWIILDFTSVIRGRISDALARNSGRLFTPTIAVFALTVLQIEYGAFTAGLRAGFGNNTFPTMNGEWFPSGFFLFEPAIRNFFENSIAVQFIHRTLGWLLLFSITGLWAYARRLELAPIQQKAVQVLTASIWVQFLLGVATLVMVVPVSVATVHQFGACIVLLALTFLLHSLFQTRVAR